MTGETMVHEVYTLRCGGSALVVSMPHCGTGLFDGLEARLTPEALDLADTDWHIPELYDFAAEFDATIIAARAPLRSSTRRIAILSRLAS